MTTWVKEDCLTLFQFVCAKIIKIGRMPRHIAFIMDGNRRFAIKYHYSNSVLGHRKGFEKLSEAITDGTCAWVELHVVRNIKYLSMYDYNVVPLWVTQWCLVLGVPEVTVYAFSIENFKRKADEVNGLIDLSREKFERILNEIDAFNELGIRVHVPGRLALLSEDIQCLISKVMIATRNNKKLRLNVAFAYTGRDEISRAASHLIDGVRKNELSFDAIDENLITRAMDVGEPELLIRTSGEVRLSDFMLWQVSNTVLYFTDVLWPELTIWNLLQAVIHFQRNAPQTLQSTETTGIQQEFLDKLERRRWQALERLVGS